MLHVKWVKSKRLMLHLGDLINYIRTASQLFSATYFARKVFWLNNLKFNIRSGQKSVLLMLSPFQQNRQSAFFLFLKNRQSEPEGLA